ncbi:flavodoxin [Marinobacterium zhoushanense]|uniref:Flavodoxin n=1 Tax=Marinobacterium zhoushanense TaxID=1679163 RepID=A0ABQ1KP84_9GAMM|nr:flavodoxin [Marinobacterium zhoushanense]GGC06188.1 flavodoxin [Marinobacterium zhoushanense]
MNKIGLFYASTTGNTESIAERIAGVIDGVSVELHDIATAGVESISGYDLLILGISTWDFGELQEDWDAEWETLSGVDFTGRKVALFGVGDQIGYGEWFLDAMGMLAERVVAQGGELVAPWPIEGYEFDASRALNEAGDSFVGLALDEDAQPGETGGRIERWVPQVLNAFGV